MSVVPGRPAARYAAEAAYAPVLRELGLTDGESVYEHPGVVPWRTVRERENCTLDATLADGRAVRLHVKRYRPVGGRQKVPATEEAEGIKLLQKAGIPTVPLAAVGVMPDGRSFVISEELYGYEAADALIQSGAVTFADLLDPTADLAAKLHDAGLHHRDLYPCHFFVKRDDPADLRLIDAGRVRPLPRILFPRRWVVKDLAQFRYGASRAGVAESALNEWLDRYAAARSIDVKPLRTAVVRKAAWIAKHDAKLRRDRPERDVTIPS